MPGQVIDPQISPPSPKTAEDRIVIRKNAHNIKPMYNVEEKGV
jgi:hypothetical protein